MMAEQRDARQGGSAHLDRIGGEARIGSGEIMPVMCPKILHLNGLSDLAVDGVEYLLARALLENVTQGVEIPVVVIPEGARCMRAAWRLFFFLTNVLVSRGELTA